jgi:hypothetical protein
MSDPTPEAYEAATWAESVRKYGGDAGLFRAAVAERMRPAVDAVWPLAVAEGRRLAAAAIRAAADDVPHIPLHSGARLKPGSTVEWAARIAEGADHG